MREAQLLAASRMAMKFPSLHEIKQATDRSASYFNIFQHLSTPSSRQLCTPS